jgi:hypothetical protein
MVTANRQTSPAVKKDLRMLATFVSMYCRGNRHENREPLTLKGIDTSELSDKLLFLCPACSKLLHHGVVKRSHCRQDPKPNCSDCTTPCYDKAYRARIREVMRYSGWRLLLRGRIDFLWHLLSARRRKMKKPPSPASQIQESSPRLVTLNLPAPSPATPKTPSDQCGHNAPQLAHALK